jgi:hypothetical protein
VKILSTGVDKVNGSFLGVRWLEASSIAGSLATRQENAVQIDKILSTGQNKLKVIAFPRCLLSDNVSHSFYEVQVDQICRLASKGSKIPRHRSFVQVTLSL